MKKTPITVLLAAAAMLAGCQRFQADDHRVAALDTPPAPRTDDAQARREAERKIPPTLVRDPSVPPASQVFAAPATSGAQDTRANDPAGRLSPQEEREQMPKSGQVNNHSSPAFEGGSSR